MKQEKYFAEVIESSLTSWLAQSWAWDKFPAFGSFVAIESKQRTIFGIVHQVQTGSMDPVRYPFPYQKTEEELLAEQPQIFEFLKTTFSCLTIGYQEKKTISYLIAPEPPKIHSFIAHPDLETSKIFFASTRYLHLLFTHSAQIFNIDETHQYRNEENVSQINWNRRRHLLYQPYIMDYIFFVYIIFH